jgi:hypothetical protein
MDNVVTGRSDKSNVVDIDLGSAEFDERAHAHGSMGVAAPFYVLGYGQPQVVVGRYADVHKVSRISRHSHRRCRAVPGWEKFNKIMGATDLRCVAHPEAIVRLQLSRNTCAVSDLVTPLLRINITSGALRAQTYRKLFKISA